MRKVSKRFRRNREQEDVELDMVPIMNMFLVLIPFLLMSASFFHLKAINTSVPVLGKNSEQTNTEKDAKLTIILELTGKSIQLSAVSDDVDYEMLDRLKKKFDMKESDQQRMNELITYLREVKQNFPSSDTLILIPEEDVIYETIIKTMDIARNFNDKPLFPNVVLSGTLG